MCWHIVTSQKLWESKGLWALREGFAALPNEILFKRRKKRKRTFQRAVLPAKFDSVCIDRTPRCRDAMWDAISWIQSTSKHQLSWNFRSIFWNIFKQWLLILLCLQSKQNLGMPLHCRSCGGSIKLHLFWELVHAARLPKLNQKNKQSNPNNHGATSIPDSWI